MSAKLYLIPNLLGTEGSVEKSLPGYNLKTIENLRHFAVEHVKDSRRFLVKCGLKPLIDQSEFEEINKHSEIDSYSRIQGWLKAGHSVGVISDAGCPGIADPGASLAKWAHKNNIRVEPLIGPSSILLALIASGMNGQSFSFHGYLDKDSSKRKEQLLTIESKVAKSGESHLFMETPYRNEALFEELVRMLNPNSLLCIAMDLSLPSEDVRTKTIAEWKKQKPKLKKRPAIFILGR